MSSADEQSVSLVDGDWNHDDERARPDSAKHSVGVRDGLPATRVKWTTDGKISLY